MLLRAELVEKLVRPNWNFMILVKCSQAEILRSNEILVV